MIKIIIASVLLLVISILVFLRFNSHGYKIKDKRIFFISSQPGGFGKEETLLENSDLLTFKIIDDSFAKDKNHVYFKGKIIAEANPDSFQRIKVNPNLIQDYYSKDHESIFQGSYKLKISDPQTFQLFPGGYYKDSKNVFYENVILKDAESATFLVKGENYTWFGVDSKSVYFFGKVLTQADAQTFQINAFPRDNDFAKDKNYHFNSMGEILR